MLVLIFKREFFFFFFFLSYKMFRYLSRLMTKPTKWHVRPAKPQIRLCLRPVWSESSMSARSKRGSLATRWVHSRDSDQTGRMPMLIWVSVDSDQTGRMPRLNCLRWAHRSFCWFCNGAAHFMSAIKATKSVIYHVQTTRAVSKNVPAVYSFFSWYCLPNLAKLFYRGSRKCTNSTEPQAMSPGDV